jgi:hypothetical protein
MVAKDWDKFQGAIVPVPLFSGAPVFSGLTVDLLVFLDFVYLLIFF